MYEKLNSLSLEIEIYAPFGTNPKELSEDFLKYNLSQGEILGKRQDRIHPKFYLILEVIREVNNHKYSLHVGRTIYQKICYVLTRNGVDTGFVFQKAEYGPYSPQVKESITALANANLIVEKELGKMIAINVVEDVVIKKEWFTAEEWAAGKKTVDLFSRIKTTQQAEMMSTVLFAFDELVKEKSVVSDLDIYDYVLDWKPHWQTKELEFDLVETIQNMAMLSQIKIAISNQLIDTIPF